MSKLFRRSIVTWIAIASGVACVAAWALWHWAAHLPERDFFGAWMPNLGTDAAVLAFTLIPLEAALRHRDRQRRARIVVPTLRQLGGALRKFAGAAALDYAQTHSDNYQRPTNEIAALLAHWQAGLDTGDTARIPDAGPLPPMFRAAKTLREIVDSLDERYASEIDDADLTATMRRFVRSATAAESVGVLATTEFWDDDTERHAVKLLAAPVRHLAEVWARTARTFDITDQQSVPDEIESADGLHRAILRQRGMEPNP